MRKAAPRVALFVFSALLTGPYVLSQSFSFSAPKAIPLPSALASTQIETLDLSGDGKTDLAASLKTGLSVLSGDGKGNFSAKPIVIKLGDPHVSLPAWYDVNGDGRADAVGAYGGYPDGGYGGAFEAWLGDGGGTLKKSFSSPLLDGLLTTMTAGDFNHDGKIDFAMAINDAYDIHEPCRLVVFLNAGGGNFRIGEDAPFARSFPHQMVTGDFNGDGRQDLAWMDDNPLDAGPMQTYYLHDLYGDGKGAFATGGGYTFAGFQPSALAATDLNHDGTTDLIVGLRAKVDANGHTLPGAAPSVVTLLGQRSGVFYQSASVSLPGIPANISLADMNGDGLEDLVINTSGANAATYILAGEAGGKFSAAQMISGTAGLAVVAPLVKGGLPAIFYPNQTGSAIELLVNTSRR